VDAYAVFERIVDDVDGHPDLAVDAAHLTRGGELDLADRGLRAAPEVLAFYASVGSFHLEWSTRDRSCHGSICIHPGREAFAGLQHWSAMLGASALSAHGRERLSSFHPLDYVRTDDQTAVGWIAEGELVTPRLGLHVPRYGGFAPAWTIEEYVRGLAQSRGALSPRHPHRTLPPWEHEPPELAARLAALFPR
jgi:hypothetical protein